MKPEVSTSYVPSAEPQLFYELRRGATPEELEQAVRSASHEDHLAAIDRAINHPGFKDTETADAALNLLEASIASEWERTAARLAELALTKGDQQSRMEVKLPETATAIKA